MKPASLLGAVLAVAVGAVTPVGCAPAAPGPASSPQPPAGPSAPVAGVHPVAAGLAAEHGHVPAGPTRGSQLTVGELGEQPWSLYLEVSRAAGLDFGALEGRPAELLITPIAGPAADTALVVLLVEGQPVGAWISPGGSSSGVLRIDERP